MKESSAEYPGRPIAVGKELSRSGLQVCVGEAIRRPGHTLQVSAESRRPGHTLQIKDVTCNRELVSDHCMEE